MADEKQYLSRIRLTDGTTVDIKDQEARTQLSELLAEDGQITVNANDIAFLLNQITWGEF